MDLYGYCTDDLVNLVDRSGLAAWTMPLVGGAIGLGYSAYDGYGDWRDVKISGKEYLASIGLGAVTGATSALGGSLGGSLLWGAGSAAINDVGNQLIKDGKVDDVGEVTKAALSGGGGAIMGKFGRKLEAL